MNRGCHHSDAARVLLWVNLLSTSEETSHHTPDALLELAILSRVDEWIDTAVGEQWYNAQVVEPVVNKHFPIEQVTKIELQLLALMAEVTKCT